MKAVLLILLPVFLLSYFLAGGIESPFPKKVAIPSGEPKTIVSQNPSGAGKQLQINTFGFATPPSPSPPPPASPQASTEPPPCISDSNRATQPGCQCPLYPFNTIGVFCNNGQTVPPYLYRIPGNHYQPIAVNISCPDGGIPCSYFNGNPPLQAAWACQANSCIYLKDNEPSGHWTSNPNYATYEAQCANNSICYAKPVIYLYPEREMQVAVKLDIPGIVTVSDPLYPEEGWQDITAYPDGKLIYKGKTYSELFFESSVTKDIVPTQGFVFSMEALPAELENLLTKTGLNKREREEFLKFWVPLLQSTGSKYMFVSFLSPAEKEQVDKVIITPEPDTFIFFLAYFKPLSQPIQVKPLMLPLEPPKRVGFTAVEWGGTIDN